MKYKDTEQIYSDVKRKISISNYVKEEEINMIKNKKSIFKSVAIACCAVFSITGVAFAKDIGSFVSNLFGYTSEGVNTAVQNGYVAIVNTDYQESNDISISVNSFLLDDDNFDITFDVKLGEKHKEFLTNYEVEYSNIDLKDLKIVNENGKIIFATFQSNFEERQRIAKEKGCEPSEVEECDSYDGGYSGYCDKIGENEFKYNITTNQILESFPIANKLIITINKVQIYNSREYGSRGGLLPDDDNCFTGEWKFELDVPENMINSRNIIMYKFKSCNDKNTKVDSTATLSNTAFKISIPETSTDKIDYDLLKAKPTKNVSDIIALGKAYVETSDGKTFEASGIDGRYSEKADEHKIENYSQTFNLTKYDATDELKVHIFTNVGKEIIIEYVRSK